MKYGGLEKYADCALFLPSGPITVIGPDGEGSVRVALRAQRGQNKALSREEGSSARQRVKGTSVSPQE